jgi:serine/threonine protein kinase
MGSVSLGVLMKFEGLVPAEQKNDEFIIKMPHKKMDRSQFIQEVAIHEVFRGIQFFAQLVCYCEEPQAIVLKYYPLGALTDLLFPAKKLKWQSFNYTFDVAFNIAYRLIWAFKIMHSKDIVHCDIKPDNILLDQDEKNTIFPVITDFGIAHVLGTAEMVQGMKLSNIIAATKFYAAPEVLSDFKKKKYNCFKKECDIYSIGILCLELFCRKSAWRKFDEEFVISGGVPGLTDKNFLPSSTASGTEIFNLVRKCLGPANERPTAESLYEALFHLNRNT